MTTKKVYTIGEPLVAIYYTSAPILKDEEFKKKVGNVEGLMTFKARYTLHNGKRIEAVRPIVEQCCENWEDKNKPQIRINLN